MEHFEIPKLLFFEYPPSKNQTNTLYRRACKVTSSQEQFYLHAILLFFFGSVGTEISDLQVQSKHFTTD